MTKYIENVNAYLAQMKIKQTYISMKTGIDTKKLSRILNGIQDINVTDMEKIAKALGRQADFFLNDSFCIPEISGFMPEKIVFYAGSPTEKQEVIAEKLMKLIENVDEVISSEYRFMNLSEE